LRKRIFRFALFAWPLFFGACASKPVKLPTDLKPEAFWADQTKRAEVLGKVEAKLSLRYTGTKQSVSGGGRFWSDSPKKMRLEIRDPLGRNQYVVVMDGKDFTAYYPRESLAYTDPAYGERYVRDFLGLDIRFSDLRDLWTGLLPQWIDSKELEGWEWDSDEEAYRARLNAKRGGLKAQLQLWIHPDLGALKILRWQMPEGALEVRFQDFEKVGAGEKNVSLAHSVTGKFENTGHKLEIDWEDLLSVGEVRPNVEYSLVIPKNVTTRALPQN
jgi:outer membrane biogenesis lipoprotein LolB